MDYPLKEVLQRLEKNLSSPDVNGMVINMAEGLLNVLYDMSYYTRDQYMDTLRETIESTFYYLLHIVKPDIKDPKGAQISFNLLTLAISTLPNIKPEDFIQQESLYSGNVGNVIQHWLKKLPSRIITSAANQGITLTKIGILSSLLSIIVNAHQAEQYRYHYSCTHGLWSEYAVWSLFNRALGIDIMRSVQDDLHKQIDGKLKISDNKTTIIPYQVKSHKNGQLVNTSDNYYFSITVWTYKDRYVGDVRITIYSPSGQQLIVDYNPFTNHISRIEKQITGLQEDENEELYNYPHGINSTEEAVDIIRTWIATELGNIK